MFYRPGKNQKNLKGWQPPPPPLVRPRVKLNRTPSCGSVYILVNLTAKLDKLRVRHILLTTKYSESKLMKLAIHFLLRNI